MIYPYKQACIFYPEHPPPRGGRRVTKQGSSRDGKEKNIRKRVKRKKNKKEKRSKKEI